VELSPEYPDEFPFRITFAYLPDEAGGWHCLGLQLEQNAESLQALFGTEDGVDITPAVMSDFAKRFKVLEAIARTYLGDFSGVEQVQEERVRAGPRRRELSPGFLRVVAKRYRERLAAGVSPVQALAREEGVSRRTAANWVEKARAAGYLEPASRGRSSKNGGK
jgi:hypothetical protein